ncbi:MAG: NUDIX domain-containing protein [Promethearchaeia archaeon]
MKYENSVGAVVYKGNECLLLKYGMGHWGLVKGNREEGELEKETILRELEEETSITDAEIIEGFKEKTDYFYKFEGDTIHKFVVYLLIRSDTKDVELSYEHEDFQWLPFDQAVEKVDYKDIKKVLEEAKNYLEKEPKKK